MPVDATRGPASSRLAGEALIGRHGDLGRLDAFFELARGGSGGVALIEGPPGIGKTAVLTEARRRAADSGMRVLAARGLELERSFAFGIVHQLLDPLIRGADGDERARLLSGAARLTEPLFDPGDAAHTATEDSHSVLHGLYWLVANAADAAPLLIAVDDAHWADLPSGRFLEFVSSRLEGLPVAVVVAARAGRFGPLLEAASSLAPAAEPRIQIEPLGPDSVAALVKGRIAGASAAVCEAAAEATGGNPFLLGELLGAIEPGSADPDAIGRFGPREVEAATLARAAEVEHGTELARAAAILGDGSELRDAAELARLDPGVAARTADALADAFVLERGPGVSFAHPIVRVAVYEGIAPAERAELHGRAARLAERHGAPPEAVATHLLQAPADADAGVVERLRGVARASLAAGAPESAVDYLTRALAEPPPDDRRAAVLHELGAAEAMGGDHPGATDRLMAAIDATGDPRERAAISMSAVGVLHLRNELVRATDLLESALSALPDPDDELAIRLESRLLPLGCTAVGARRRLGRRLADARERVDVLPPHLRRWLLAPVAADLILGERPDRARAAALAREVVADEVVGQAEVTFAIGGGFALLHTGHYAEAAAAFDSLVSRAQAAGSMGDLAITSGMRAWCRFHQGRLAEAEADIRAPLEAAGAPRAPVVDPLGAALLVAIMLERGELDGASEALAQLGPLRADEDLGFAQTLHLSEARVLMALGDNAGAEAALEHCRSFERAWGPAPGIATVVPWRSAMALARRASDGDAAAELAAEQVELARSFGGPRPIGTALCVLGRVSGDGIEALEEAVDVLAGADAELEHARAQVWLGSALRRAGSRSAAREPLTAGMDLAHRLGSSTLAERARQELVAAGARPRRLAASGPGALTASELRVAEMAASGMTNREIAQALFVTLRTIEGHLTRAFRKLEISSRQELPAAMAEDPSPA